MAGHPVVGGGMAMMGRMILMAGMILLRGMATVILARMSAGLGRAVIVAVMGLRAQRREKTRPDKRQGGDADCG
ncbi:hypothetical protein [Roseovarius sp. MBR-38]